MQGHEVHELIRALNVKYIPGGLPVLVLSHGFGSDQSVWQNTISNFRKDPQFSDSAVLTYDLAFSGKVSRDYYCTNKNRYETIDGYVEDIVHVLQHYHISQCVFVGHSFSGMIGIVASTRHRDLFDHLILIGTTLCFVDKTKYKLGYSRKKANQRLELMEVDYKRWVEEYINIALPKSTERFRAKLDSMLCNMTPNVVRSTASTVFCTDLRNIVPQVTTRCTIIKTCSNTIATAFGQNYMLAQMNNARAKVSKIKTKGHFPHLTKGKLVAAEISNIIREWRTEHQPSPSISCLVPYDSLWEKNMFLTRRVEALEQELQNNRIHEEARIHEMNRREETHAQEINLLKRKIEALENHQPAVQEQSTSAPFQISALDVDFDIFFNNENHIM